MQMSLQLQQTVNDDKTGGHHGNYLSLSTYSLPSKVCVFINIRHK